MNVPANTPSFNPGSIVRARDREWIVLPESRGDDLYLRPLGSGDDDRVRLLAALEQVEQALFPTPDPGEAREGSRQAGLLLRDALLLKLRAGAGPFRAIGNLAFEPRAYQLVPLLMALRLEVIRLLIADDVGIGKTIEAGLILRELIDRGEVRAFTVLCPPHLCEQWQEELAQKFHLRPEIVSRHTAARLERGLLQSESLFQHYPYTVVSLDYIKSNRRRDEFLASCPDFVIVDEAHTCVQGSAQSRHQRHALLKGLSGKAARHMLLLTATPHSGDEQAFRNLLGLLDPAFATLDRLDDTRNPLRQHLAQHMVQRRRQDIAEWQDSTQFPDREVGETAYHMRGEWMSLFQDVVDYARELVERAERLDQFQQRLHWWAALALLRCISSSPAAAVRTLQNRIDRSLQTDASADALESLDELGSRTILDSSDDTQDDLEPGAQLEDIPLLRSLIERAGQLQGPKADPKLAQLIAALEPLLEAGHRPVVFCRYIPTAHYVADYLSRRFKERSVACVTGELHPAEREERVHELGVQDALPILVATDCLSEGINLQDIFDAVVHYDLAWNPTRHEQREGRVDRFGQCAPLVKALMLYGDNNPVDGAVLRVILRKAEAIRKALGVSVPMPEDENRVTQAIMQTVLLTRGTDSGMSQMGLAFDDVESLDSLDERVEVAWESARDKAKRNRTIFAQQAIHPEEVLPEWQRMQEVLGSQADVERFVREALAALRAPLEKFSGIWKLSWQELPHGIRQRLESHGFHRLERLSFTREQLPRDVAYVHRSHPLVTVLADELAERALDGTDLPTSDRPARRAGAITTAKVNQHIIVALLRLRTNLTLERDGTRLEMLAEEAVTVALEANQPPRQLTTQETLELFSHEATQNTSPEVRERAVRQALERLEEHRGVLNEIGRRHAHELLQDHRRVRDSERQGRGSFQVNPQLPADVLGVYVLMPEVAF